MSKDRAAYSQFQRRREGGGALKKTGGRPSRVKGNSPKTGGRGGGGRGLNGRGVKCAFPSIPPAGGQCRRRPKAEGGRIKLRLFSTSRPATGSRRAGHDEPSLPSYGRAGQTVPIFHISPGNGQ